MKPDKAKLEQIIRDLAEDDLGTVSASSLKLYASDIRDAFRKELRRLISESYDENRERLSVERQCAFTDLESGYMVRMLNWIDSHPMKIPELPCMEDEEAPDVDDRTALRHFVKSRDAHVVGGTAVGAAICLVVPGLKIVAIVAEAIAIAYGIYKYADTKSSLQAQVQAQNEKRLREIERTFNEYIQNTNAAAFAWLEQGISKSQELIDSY